MQRLHSVAKASILTPRTSRVSPFLDKRIPVFLAEIFYQEHSSKPNDYEVVVKPISNIEALKGLIRCQEQSADEVLTTDELNVLQDIYF